MSSSEEVSDDEYIPAPAGGCIALPSSAEVARFGAAKERKLSLENAITVFNRYGIMAVKISVYCLTLDAVQRNMLSQ